MCAFGVALIVQDLLPLPRKPPPPSRRPPDNERRGPDTRGMGCRPGWAHACVVCCVLVGVGVCNTLTESVLYGLAGLFRSAAYTQAVQASHHTAHRQPGR
jgi:hypothetical protein